MKIFIKNSAFIGLLLGSFVFTACEGEDIFTDLLEEETRLSDTYLMTESSISNTYQIIDQALRDSLFRAQDSSLVDGATVTKTGNLIRIDYGFGAIASDGRPRRGYIEVIETSDYRSTGGSVIASLEHYILNEVDLKGDLSIFNYGSDSLSIIITDFMALDSMVVDASRTISWISGFNTSILTDDKYRINGSAHGDHALGFLDVISSSPLLVHTDCEHRILSGVMDISIQGDSIGSTGSIDFIAADGCDNLAKIELKKGEQELMLTRQFFGF